MSAARPIELMESEPEAITNGVWFHILSLAFPFPTYIIAPEYRSSGSNRGDLFVIRAHDNKKVFSFEGKKANIKLEDVAGQIIAYLKDISANRGYAFGVAASGPLYAVLQYDGSNAKVRTANLQSGGLGNGIDGDLTHPSDLTVDQNLTHVVAMVASIEAWISVNVH